MAVKHNLLMDAHEAADYLGISRRGLKYHVQQGNISPTYRIGKGRIWVFDVETLDAFQKTRRGPGRPPLTNGGN